MEDISRGRNARQSNDFHGNGRSCLLCFFAAIINERPDTPTECSHDIRVAHSESSALDQHRRNRAPTAFNLGFDDGAFGLSVWIRLEFKHFRLQQNHLEQGIEPRFLFGGYLDHNGISAPCFGDQSMFGEGVFDPIRVGGRLINLIHRHDQRHSGCLGMMDRFDGLRHDSVVSRDDQNDDIRDLGSTSSHGRKGFVARSVQKRHLLPTH